MPSRIHKRKVIISFEVERNNNKYCSDTVINNVVTFNKPKRLVSRHSNTFIPTRITPVTTDDEIFCDSCERENE